MRSAQNYLFIAPLTDRSNNLSQIIESTLSTFNIKPVKSLVPDEGLSDDDVMFERIQDYIEDADLVIGDVSGANPNVMHSIGLAQGLRKLVLPIVRRDEKAIPSSLGRINYLVYDPESPESLARYLKNWAVHYLPVKV